MALTTEEYANAEFDANGHVYNLADEVLSHLVELALAEQREHEKQTGQRAPQARHRPEWKKKKAEQDA